MEEEAARRKRDKNTLRGQEWRSARKGGLNSPNSDWLPFLAISYTPLTVPLARPIKMLSFILQPMFPPPDVAAVAEWYRYRTVTCFVTGSSPVPLKTRRVGQRCTLNLSRAETSSRWCGVVVRRGWCQLR
ncbi:uncharacterized protein TNCV_3047111 [Trichonephila clavipes]|nr:uncharacterized protein TNCV_3047111 [Trichonephila clavipes]